MSTQAITEVFEVPLPPEAAFGLFVDRLGTWWPREYTWSQDALEGIGIEPGVNGWCYERGPYGIRLDWGRVVFWEPPASVTFTWQISPQRVPEPNPDHASEVAVRFEAAGTGTRVTVDHHAFDRHGPGGDEYRHALASAQGWPFMLDRYREQAELLARAARSAGSETGAESATEAQ